MNKSLLFFQFLLLFNIHTQAQPDTIQFSLNQQHNICVKVCLNRSDSLTLMFHSSSTGVTLTAEVAEKTSSLKPGQSTEVETWGGSANAAYSTDNSMSINRLNWDSLTVFINENSGVGTGGKFGFDLFDGKILEIDYDHQRMVVHSSMPQLPKGYKRTPLFIKNGSTFIPGELKIGRSIYRDTFMFHTGYGGSVLLDPAIGEQHGMQAKLKTVSTSELKDAYGNVFKIETKKLPLLKVGGRKVKKATLSFAARSASIPMKVFGNGLLRRFNVVFDFRENVAYLQPNRFWKAP